MYPGNGLDFTVGWQILTGPLPVGGPYSGLLGIIITAGGGSMSRCGPDWGGVYQEAIQVHRYTQSVIQGGRGECVPAPDSL